MIRVYSIATIVALALCGWLVAAQESDDDTVYVPKLRLGDKAPPLRLAEYARGTEVDFDKDKGKYIYVIEFWATWCPPCRESVPHLSELQAKYRDDNVIIVGVSTEAVSDVKTFVEKLGEKMDYVVAIDDDEYTTNHYMGGFGRTSIPHAFVIGRDGRFSWEGPPMMVEEGIKLVLSDDEDDEV